MAKATETYSPRMRGFGLGIKCSIQTYVLELLGLVGGAIWEFLDPAGGSKTFCLLFPDLSRGREQPYHPALTVSMGCTLKP